MTAVGEQSTGHDAVTAVGEQSTGHDAVIAVGEQGAGLGDHDTYEGAAVLWVQKGMDAEVSHNIGHMDPFTMLSTHMQ